LDKQYDIDLCHVDYPITESRHAKLPPPPYKQVISNYNIQCDSKCKCSKYREESEATADNENHPENI